MEHIALIASMLQVRGEQVAATVELLDNDNTIPFIARYRKEATGGLDEEQIRQLSEQLDRLRTLDERRQTVLKSIEEQGVLTPELRAQIMAAASKTELEDLYQPYKPKRKTRASVARERGLQPLADLILSQERSLAAAQALIPGLLSEEVQDEEQAWAGARDIVAETISDHPEVRRVTREKALAWGVGQTERIEGAQDEKRTYETYYEFEARLNRLRPHQVLAINRGESEKVLRIRVQVPERDWRGAIEAVFRLDRRSPFAVQLESAAQDAAERLLLPAIERDVRRQLTEDAERHAIHVFAENLRNLLMQPPLSDRVVLGIDPGFRTGCKAAVVDPTGKLLDTATIYPHEPQKRMDEARAVLGKLIAKHSVSLISIGNGTASRETEALVAELTRTREGLSYIITNEAGASVYSASPLARLEFPDLDVSMRGAVSIARRVQDPLAELVKIDPKSIGVGMYQHDVDQKQLAGALNALVESVVNRVGVDLNTASAALLTYVAGIGPKLAERIVEYRDGQGRFQERAELLKVSGLGPKAFEQAAGFLRIRDGANALDASAIHPESYAVVRKLLEKAALSLEASPAGRKQALEALRQSLDLEVLAAELGTGAPTLLDIFDQLIQPGRDPRADIPAPILRSDVLSMEDLSPGMVLKGTVRNVVDFGAFVDIGVKQDGLLHISQIPRGSSLGVGDVIDVKVLKVEAERGRISLGWTG